MLIPAIEAKQFHLFREGQVAVGAALWAKLDEAAERALLAAMENTDIVLEPAVWTSGDRIWLMDIIAPYANVANRHLELMIGDLVAGPFKGKEFKAFRSYADGASRSVVTFPAAAAELLKAEVAVRFATMGVS